MTAPPAGPRRRRLASRFAQRRSILRRVEDLEDLVARYTEGQRMNASEIDRVEALVEDQRWRVLTVERALAAVADMVNANQDPDETRRRQRVADAMRRVQIALRPREVGNE